MSGVNEATTRVRNQVAILLACSRTRLDKSRWASVLHLLERADSRNISAGSELERQLLAERDFLRAVLENTN